MGFVTPLLLGGLLLVGIPIVLHLMMRREPRSLEFPALRFVQARRSKNQRNLQLRQVLLLLTRCAIIGLLAFALARPSYQGSGVRNKENAPISAILLLDNSLRMEYLHHNQTRLQAAQKLGDWLLAELPADSTVGVMDRTARKKRFSTDRMAARLQLAQIKTTGLIQPLKEAVTQAIELLKTRQEDRHEIYILTDMTEATWNSETLSSIKKSLASFPNLSLYLIDVGAPNARNRGLEKIKLSSQQITPNETLTLETILYKTALRDTPTSKKNSPSATEKKRTNQVTNSTSPAIQSSEKCTVELFLKDKNGKLKKRGHKTVELISGQPQKIKFSLSQFTYGTHQGEIRLVGNDPLTIDDQRYFSVQVRDPYQVLILAKSSNHALFLQEALSPTLLQDESQKFQTTFQAYNKVTPNELNSYAAIFLLDPPPLINNLWQGLVDFVQSGKGVGIFLGREADLNHLNRPLPQQLLPGLLKWQSRNASYLKPQNFNHPCLAEFQEFADQVPWAAFPVYKYWQFQSLAEKTNVLIAYENLDAALLEKTLEKGRVLTMTTPVSDLLHDTPWNLLTTGEPWPFLTLSDGIAAYLCSTGEGKLNFKIGEMAVFPFISEKLIVNFVLETPDKEPIRMTQPVSNNRLTISSTQKQGNYRIQHGRKNQPLGQLSFSVNANTKVGHLERISSEEILKELDTKQVQYVRNRNEIKIQVGLGRFGNEWYPFLIALVAVALGFEHVLANRFYRNNS